MSIFNILKKQRETEYKEYIKNHINNVHIVWASLKSNPNFKDLVLEELQLSDHEYENMILILDHDIEQHDKSKYDAEEFDAYRKEFYPVTPEEKEDNKNNMKRAFVHHYTHNHHHWDWYYENKCEDKMPAKNIIHMIVDWAAMGLVPGNDSTIEWYNKNKNDIHLGEKQRIFAEKLIDIISQ